MRFVVTVGREPEVVEVSGGDGRYRLLIGDREWQVDARLSAQGICSLIIDGVSYIADVADRQGACVVEVRGESYAIDVEEETRHIIRTRAGATGGEDQHTIRAPMPGRITLIPVAPGHAVVPGDTLVVVEAMKMENELKAIASGTVREVRVEPGQAVNAGDVLIVLD